MTTTLQWRHWRRFSTQLQHRGYFHFRFYVYVIKKRRSEQKNITYLWSRSGALRMADTSNRVIQMLDLWSLHVEKAISFFVIYQTYRKHLLYTFRSCWYSGNRKKKGLAKFIQSALVCCIGWKLLWVMNFLLGGSMALQSVWCTISHLLPPPIRAKGQQYWAIWAIWTLVGLCEVPWHVMFVEARAHLHLWFSTIGFQ